MIFLSTLANLQINTISTDSSNTDVAAVSLRELFEETMRFVGAKQLAVQVLTRRLPLTGSRSKSA